MSHNEVKKLRMEKHFNKSHLANTQPAYILFPSAQVVQGPLSDGVVIDVVLGLNLMQYAIAPGRDGCYLASDNSQKTPFLPLPSFACRG